MTAAPTIARLERVADALAAGRAPEPDDARHHAEALQAFLRRDAQDLDEAFGLARGRGGQGPRQTAAKALRDEYLAEASHRFNLGAKELAIELDIYFCRGGWRADQTAAECPDGLKGSLRELLWHSLKAWPRPIGDKQIANILNQDQRKFSRD